MKKYLPIVAILGAGLALALVWWWQTPTAVTPIDNTSETATSTVVYTSTEYGFRVTLPASWQGYRLVDTRWFGNQISEGTAIRGPMVTLRHPAWTAERPRQDIPILILTHDEWSLIEQEKLAIGAAPVPPTKLGQNNRYVFALSARYNYAFPEGFEEVETIIQGGALTAFDLSS